MSDARPILYSFRRCPYAMRARMAIAASGVECRLREGGLRDKPAEMLEASPKGTVPVIVEADGTVSNCHLEQNTIADSLNSPACQIAMAVAEMEPAEDANGKPLRSFYATTITYSMNP